MKVIQMNLEQGILYPVDDNIVNNLPAIKQMAIELEKITKNKKPVALWCRGSSGAIITGIIASLMPIVKIVHVKKEGEDSHEQTQIWDKKIFTHVFCDDFIYSGKTMKAIFEYADVKPFCICLGAYCSKHQINSVPSLPKYLICNKFNQDERNNNPV
jgi:hypothetical protein